MFGGTNLVVRMHKLLSAPTYIVFNRYFSFSRFNRFKHELLRDFDNSKFSDTKFTCRSTRVVLNLVLNLVLESIYSCDFKKSGYRGGSPGRVIFVV